MANQSVRCKNCQKIFFDIGETNCPFCGKDRYIYPKIEMPEFFKNIFKEFDK